MIAPNEQLARSISNNVVTVFNKFHLNKFNPRAKKLLIPAEGKKWESDISHIVRRSIDLDNINDLDITDLAKLFKLSEIELCIYKCQGTDVKEVMSHIVTAVQGCSCLEIIRHVLKKLEESSIKTQREIVNAFDLKHQKTAYAFEDRCYEVEQQYVSHSLNVPSDMIYEGVDKWLQYMSKEYRLFVDLDDYETSEEQISLAFSSAIYEGVLTLNNHPLKNNKKPIYFNILKKQLGL